MTTFMIDNKNNITVVASSQQIEESGEGTDVFGSQQELAALAAKWRGARLVEIWNSLPGVEPVERFTSRQVATTRIWKAIQHLQRHSWPTAPARRAEGGKCEEQGHPPGATRSAGKQQDGEGGRTAATARGGDAARTHASHGLADP